MAPGEITSLQLAKHDPGDTEIRRLQVENDHLRRDKEMLQEEIDDLKVDLRDKESELRTVMSGVHRMRASLKPLYDSLRMLWGEMDVVAEEDAPAAAPSQSKHAHLWKDWQRKLGEGTAAGKAIEVLLMHGKMKREALKVHLKCGSSTLTDAIYKLNRADLIVKDGSYISLKEL